MSISINGVEIQEKCTVLEGLTFLHIHIKNMSSSTKKLFKDLQDDSVHFTCIEDDDFYDYPTAKIIYLGNNTLYVCNWIN